MSFATLVSTALNIEEVRVQSAIKMFDEGATVPFIARYRKDVTGSLDETQLRDIQHRYDYFKELGERKDTVLKTIEEQGKMTPELLKQIESCIDKVKLEDIYLPFKPKRRTKATIAKENGLEPLARIIEAQEATSNTAEEIARIYLNEEKGLTSYQAAIKGALEILAEEVSENAEYRQTLRTKYEEEGSLESKVRKEFEGKKTKFENYYEFSERINKIPSHRVLAIRRGEKEKVLRIGVLIDDMTAISYLISKVVTNESIWKEHIEVGCKDAWERLLKPSMETEVRLLMKNVAEEEALQVFGKNLEDVLLAAPAGQKSVLALDPGFKSGVKVAVMDKNGKFLHQTVIYPNPPQNKVAESGKLVKNLIEQFDVEMIAIGNGTASRETEAFAGKVISNLSGKKPIKVIVNEAGASVYSASPEAIKEFPNEDVTTRGAISIGRRLQDPLAELVKVEPKSIGVGQYQHDVNQRNLKKSLDEVVESCVNRVGVNLNTASASLLSYVAGVSKTIAKNIIEFRDKNGSFKSRKELMKVPSFGPKAFEQSAGFMKIANGENPLDASSVHPESYALITEMAKDQNVEVNSLIGVSELVRKIEVDKYLSDTMGKHTLEDIIKEIEKPSLDPRSEFKYAKFNDKVNEIQDLVTNSWMEGVVTNVTNFGAFVDIGVHQDGLIHISEIGDKFVQDAKEVLKVGDVVTTRVIAVDTQQKRIALSMRGESAEEGRSVASKSRSAKQRNLEPASTIADLKNKFAGSKNDKKKGQAKKPKISLKSIMRSGR